MGPHAPLPAACLPMDQRRLEDALNHRYERNDTYEDVSQIGHDRPCGAREYAGLGMSLRTTTRASGIAAIRASATTRAGPGTLNRVTQASVSELDSVGLTWTRLDSVGLSPTHGLGL